MGKKILLVEDESSLLALVENRLKAKGYEVICATDGASAYEMARKEKPDLMILDLMLPKMDGLRVCALLKKDTRYARIPIILFTARAPEESQRLGQEAGADFYLTKPFDSKVLLDKIEELLGGGSHVKT